MRKVIIFLFVIVFSLSIFNSVLAKSFQETSGLMDTGKKTGHVYSAENGSIGALSVFQTNDLTAIIGFIIKMLLSFIGVVFLLLMIYGGYIWMLARGNDQEVEKAKNIIKNAIIGLAVVLSAYAITLLVGSVL